MASAAQVEKPSERSLGSADQNEVVRKIQYLTGATIMKKQAST
jgi:hypothetical protein